jgi:general secretion pathway protein C
VSATAWYDELRSGPGWVRLFEQHGARLLVIVLLTALAIDSALILTRALSHHAIASSTVPMGASSMQPAVNPAVELANIVNAHLFGRAGVTGGDNAPLTTMPLILAGVIAGNDPNKGQAIIGASAASAKLCAVGAMISGGARLHSIFSDHVLIERNGGLETLKLPHTAPNASPAIKPMAGAPPAPPHTDAQRDNSTVLAGLVRIQPVFNQGKLSGYRIFPGGGRGNTAFTQLGLRSGDLIVAINGSPLDDAGRAMEVMQTLSSASSATVTVSRSGVTQEVNLNLANLNVDAESNPGDNAAAGAPGGDAAPASTPGANANRSRVTPSGPMNGSPSNPGSPTDAPPATESPPAAAGAIGDQR